MSRQLIDNLTDLTFADSPYAVQLTDGFLNVSTVAGDVILNLPLAADAKYRYFLIKKIDASTNTITIQPQGGETVDGAGSRVLEAPYALVNIYSDGIAWFCNAIATGGQGPNGTLYMSAPAPTPLAAAGETKILGTTTGKNLNLFSHTNGRLTYDGANPIRVLVVVQASLVANNPSILAQLRVALNGAGIADSESQQEIPVGADVESAPFVTTVDLVNNDFLEPFIETPDFGVGVTVTAEKLVMSVVGIQDLSSSPGLQRTYGESLGVDSITGTTAWQTKLTVPMPGTSPAGTYRIIWSAEIKNDGTNAEAMARVEDASGIVYAEPMIRMAGTPANQWIAIGGIIEAILGAGGISFYILYATSSNPRTTSIRRARLEILRVP